MAIDLLQHNLERFGVVTVMDVMLLDYATKKPILFLDTLKISSINAESGMKEIKGGQYADLLITYDFARSMNVEFQDALLSFESMKTLWGAEIERDASKIITHQREVLPVQVGTGTDKTIELAYNPIENEDNEQVVLRIINQTQKLADEELTYTIANNVITFTVGADEGDIIEVYYQAYADEQVDATNLWEPVQALLKSSSFPKTVAFVGKTFFITQQDGKKIEAEIEFPKMKLNSNFTLALESEGDASTFDFGGMVLIDGLNKELAKIKTLRFLD